MKDTMQSIVQECTAQDVSIGEWMLRREVDRSGSSRGHIFGLMQERLQVMKQAVRDGLDDLTETENQTKLCVVSFYLQSASQVNHLMSL